MEKYVISSPLLSVTVIPYGATVTSIKYCGREQILGYETLEEYKQSTCYIGAFVGRYANRIAKGKINLNGNEYTLDINNGENHLHGGLNGASFKAFTVKEHTESSVLLTLFSPNGECGYPAAMEMSVKYTVCGDTLRIDFYGESDGDTVYAPTSHLYFAPQNVFEAVVSINAEDYVPVNESNIPTGGLARTKGEFDFNTPRKIQRNYDHCFILRGENAFTGEANGCRVSIKTNFPALQLYTGEFLCDGFNKNAGYAVEPEYPPNSPNVKVFPSPILKKGERFCKYAEYKFE